MDQVHIFRSLNKKVNNISEDTNIQIAYKTANKVQKYVQLKQQNSNEYEHRLRYIECTHRSNRRSFKT
jgi:ribosomal 50S subunit-recycling heat shock protein